MKHTPGPWVTENDHIVVRNYDGKLTRLDSIAKVFPDFPLSDEAIANARLIAAAPDLLDALKVMLHGEEIGECECQKTGFPRLITRWEKARAAIAKAEGGGS